MEAVAIEQTRSDRITHTDDNPYVRRQRLAIEQCRPKEQGGTIPNLQAFEWLELPITRTWVFNRQKNAWLEDESVRSTGDLRYIQNKVRDASYPCGKSARSQIATRRKTQSSCVRAGQSVTRTYGFLGKSLARAGGHPFNPRATRSSVRPPRRW